MAASGDLRVESLGDHPELLEQVGLLRWKEWAFGARDLTPFIEVTANEAGPSGQLPMTLVAINVAGGAVGAVRLAQADEALGRSSALAGRPGSWAWLFARKAGSGEWAVSCWRACRKSLRHSATLGPGLPPATMRSGSISVRLGSRPAPDAGVDGDPHDHSYETRQRNRGRMRSCSGRMASVWLNGSSPRGSRRHRMARSSPAPSRRMVLWTPRLLTGIRPCRLLSSGSIAPAVECRPLG
jgi:hypothetical protein